MGALDLNMDAAARSFLTLSNPETNLLRWQQGSFGSRPLPAKCSTSASRSLLDSAPRTNAFLMAFFCGVCMPQALPLVSTGSLMASSPSSRKVWCARRISLRAMDRGARLAPMRSLVRR
jgi:hypothetical protein